MSWDATAGQITCVLGPNGAGKTTVIEMAEGLRRPQQGDIKVLGVDPWRAPAAHRARVGVMLQDGGLPGSVRPLRLLAHLASLYTVDDRADLVDTLGIEEFGHTATRRLSGGQRQRLALAAALVGRPEVVFLDEPSAGLDPHSRLDVWDLVRSARDRGCAVVVTTHSFEEAERLADRVVVVAAGKVVADGTVSAVCAGNSADGDGTLESAYFALTRTARTA
ncbi:ABC transporter ATP-binding protein [Allobranchiibius sp. CTAmp26]|uniref:ABC transporter ATP-binding protein n=1 Tax=Allobranchiibius sp. CTAmp26 TaxID=2815214 RepID=UPI001AA1B0AD|nr:ABC transporter ATP-binding protein [Allobranchiibius sp. CTAmp26]MBO1754123.1 ABC transporter ATP-binding protein [Allobranchiibius sp. CTAmp26]